MIDHDIYDCVKWQLYRELTHLLDGRIEMRVSKSVFLIDHMCVPFDPLSIVAIITIDCNIVLEAYCPAWRDIDMPDETITISLFDPECFDKLYDHMARFELLGGGSSCAKYV